MEGNQPLPGVGDPSTWASLDGAPTALSSTSRSSPRSRRRCRRPAATTTRSRRASASARGTVSSSSPRTRSPRRYTEQPRLLRRRGRRGHRGRLLGEHVRPGREWGPAFHDIRHNFVLSANYELPWGQGRSGAPTGRASPTRSSAAGRWRHLPAPDRHPRHRDRRGEPLAAGRARLRAAELRRRLGAREPGRDRGLERAGRLALDRHQRLPGAALGTFGNCPIGVAVRRATRTSTSCSPSGSTVGGGALPRVPGRGVQRAQPPDFGAAGARHQRSRTRSA